jgi:purine-binding chemotaxis protein CheW
MRQSGHMASVQDYAQSMSLIFWAGSVLCAQRLDEVIETMRPLAVRPLAGTPAYVRGVTIMRGVPTPVVDVARLVGGEPAGISRFVAVRTESGPVAFATGPILGIRTAVPDEAAAHPVLFGGASSQFITGVGAIDAEPVLLLRSMRIVLDEVSAGAAGAQS